MHPVAPDERFTYEQNLDHTLHMMKLCYDEGFRVYAPWHTICLVMPDAEPAFSKLGLEVDCSLIKMTGLGIACGHKISAGMQVEIDALMERPDGYWINGTAMHDKHFCDLLREHRKRLAQYWSITEIRV